jgi:hypothetical protein
MLSHLRYQRREQQLMQPKSSSWLFLFFLFSSIITSSLVQRTPGVGFSECMLFSAIATNLVTLLTTVLHESKVDAARNISSWSGVCYLTPLLGAFVADSYLGRYWTMVVFLPVYIVVSSSEQQLMESDRSAIEYECN